MSDSSIVSSSSSSENSSSSSEEEDLAALVVAEASLVVAKDSTRPNSFAARLERAADRIHAHDGRRNAKRVKKRRKFDPGWIWKLSRPPDELMPGWRAQEEPWNES